MSLDRKQIAGNYRRALERASQLLQHKIRRRYGRGLDIDPENEIVLTAVSDPVMVGLISSVAFDPVVYDPILIQNLDQAGKQLFPDVYKKRFTGLESIAEREKAVSFEEAKVDGELDILKKIIHGLSVENRIYLEKRLMKQNPGWYKTLAQQLSRVSGSSIEHMIQISDAQLTKIRLCYPQGQIAVTRDILVQEILRDEQIIACYKNVYCGIDRGFPKNFLKKNGRYRAALLTRFLVEKILQDDPLRLMREEDEMFFIRHRLQNVYRYFNYSANRAFHNAYPEIVPVWLNSRIDPYFWEQKKNRIRAVRWLVEDILKLSVGQLPDAHLHRRDFSRNGLSYLFNTYYNSVRKALQEAYPQYPLWRLGTVEKGYWTMETARTAVRELIDLKGWSIDTIPEKYRSGEFGRHTFSRMGLGTMFEKFFSRNVYRALDAAWPGRFMPWEFGKVPAGFWLQSGNLRAAVRWIAVREELAQIRLYRLVEIGKLSVSLLKKYAVGRAVLKNTGGKLRSLFVAEASSDYLWKRINFRLRTVIDRERQKRNWRMILLHGLCYPAVCQVSRYEEERYTRMLRRRKRWEAQFISG